MENSFTLVSSDILAASLVARRSGLTHYLQMKLHALSV